MKIKISVLMDAVDMVEKPCVLSAEKICQEATIDQIPDILSDFISTKEHISLPIEIILNLESNLAHKPSFNQSNVGQVQLGKLTSRENQVLDLLMKGKRSSEIASELFLSFETIKSYRKKILQKIGVGNTVILSRLYHLNAI